MPIGSRLFKHLPIAVARPRGPLARYGLQASIRRTFASSSVTLSGLTALSRKVAVAQGDLSVPPPNDVDTIGVHEQNQHAVISAFDLFSVGGA